MQTTPLLPSSDTPILHLHTSSSYRYRYIVCTHTQTHTHTHTQTHTHTYIYIYIYIYSRILFVGGERDNPLHLKIYQNHTSRSNPLPPHLPHLNLLQKLKENLPPSRKKLVLSYRNLFIGNILIPVWKGHHTDMNSIGH